MFYIIKFMSLKMEDAMENKNKKTKFQYLSLVTQLGLNSAMPVIMGVLFGGFLDRKLNTDGIFAIIFLVLGGMTGVYNIYKLAGPRKKEKDDE